MDALTFSTVRLFSALSKDMMTCVGPIARKFPLLINAHKKGLSFQQASKQRIRKQVRCTAPGCIHALKESSVNSNEPGQTRLRRILYPNFLRTTREVFGEETIDKSFVSFAFTNLTAFPHLHIISPLSHNKRTQLTQLGFFEGYCKHLGSPSRDIYA